ncbi:reverse transcriptase domain-containing protein [Tanacetum coccineum]
MLVECDYDSWKNSFTQVPSRRGKPNGKLIWNLIQNGLTTSPMIHDPPKPTDLTVVPAYERELDSEFSEEENKLEIVAYAKDQVKDIQKGRRILFMSEHQVCQQPSRLLAPMSLMQKDSQETGAVYKLKVYCYLLSGFQKQFPPTNNQLRTSSNSRTHATVHDGHIVTEPVQRKAPGNNGNTGARGIEESTAPYDHTMATDYNKMFQAIHEDAYDSDVDEGPNAAVAFMAQLSYIDYQSNQEMHTEKLVRLDAETEIDDIRFPVSSVSFDTEAPKCSNERSRLYGQACSTSFVMLLITFHPTHHPVSIWDSEEVLVHQVVSMKKMNEKPGHVRPANDFYAKLNALMFVPQKELSGDQAYWLSANEIASQASKSATPGTPFVHKSRPPSQVLASLRKVNAVFPQFEGIIKERTTQQPDYVSEWCYDYAKQFVEQQLVPFYDHFKKHIQAANDTFFKEIKEFEQIFDELEAEYEQCVLDNKNLTIEKKNLLIKNDCLIAECLEKDICSIVLTSDSVVPPSSNYLCEDLRSACDREHTKVLELEAEISKQKQLITESEKRFAFLEQNYVSLQLKFQNYKQCSDTSSASNAIFEINKLRDQLQGKDATIRNLDAQINIMKVLNVGSTEGSCDQQALDTDRIQLQDMITSLRIQLDGLKVENVSLKRRYDELSKANTHSRTAYTEKLSALTAEHTKLQAQVTGKTSSGPSTSETPKVLAPGMYNLGSKYIPPPKRANWVKSTQLPKTKQVTFIEPPRPSLKPTPKPVVHHNKQTNVCVPMSTGVKPTSGASKPVPKKAPRNHSSLPAKSANARRVEAHHRTLNKKNRIDSNLLVRHSVFVSNSNNDCGARNKSLVSSNHNACLVMCDDSVNVKPHQTKRITHQPTKEWKPIKRVGKPIKRVWNHISKNVANTKPQWKPTGRHFSLYEKYPLTRIMEPTDIPMELPPSASSSPQITMVSRFTEHKLSDRQAGSTNCSMKSSFGLVRFGNDEYAAIVGYGDYKLGDTIISRVYYVEGLKHNLFSVGQFCDGGLEVAFRQHSCHIRNYDMVDLLNGSRTTNLYSISLNDMMSASPVCLLTKASSTKSWLWHRRLNHLNFRTLNELARNNLVRGLPMLKYDKDHLCPSCQLGKSKKASHPLKAENTNTEVLHTLHMDLCGPMRTKVITERICLVIVDDYTDLGWVIPPPAVLIPPVNAHATQALENAIGSPSTTVISEGAPAVPESLLPHQIPLPDTSDSDIETLFDNVDSNVFDTYTAPETDSEASSSNSVNIDVTPNNQLPHVQKWTQAHPLENIIGNKDRPVSTMK